MPKKLIVIADDFTGANDAGVQFRKAGLKVNIIIETNRLKEELMLADLLVVDLESRFDLKETAYQKCYDLGKQLSEVGNIIIYKKIDSTFRGNIGAEIDGLMDSMNLEVALLAPALPTSGRATVNGEVYVHGIRLEGTEFARDPRTPVQRSRIAEIISSQSNRACKEISVELIRQGPVTARQKLTNEIKAGSEIFIFDCHVQDDLEHIAKLAEAVKDLPVLIIGSAGLAGYISSTFVTKREHPGFVFSGSVSEQSAKQIRYAMENSTCSLYKLDAESLLNENYPTGSLETSVAGDMNKGIKRFIFTSALSREDVIKVFSLAEENGYSRDEAVERVAMSIGKLASVLTARFDPVCVLLTGGDTAIKTVRALNGTGLSIDRELVPGIPSGTLTGSSIKTIIATKSGGFGSVDAISKTLDFFNL